jgi:putative SOS response-associated peptidase YedK
MEPIHDRMPVIVELEKWQSWLSGMSDINDDPQRFTNSTSMLVTH